MKTSKFLRILPAVLIIAGLTLMVGQYFKSQGNQEIPVSNVTHSDFQPKPSRIKIEKIGVDATVIDLGLNPDRTLEVPKEKADVGWYTQSSSPGAVGPSILVGHLDAADGPGVFHRLRELTTGDLVSVERADGSQAIYKVESQENYDQDNFPTDKVYGAIDHAGIRLITCSGKYSILQGRYSENLVVYGSLFQILEKNI